MTRHPLPLNGTSAPRGVRGACSLLSGAGLMLASTPSEAEIIYSGIQNVKYPLSSPSSTNGGLVRDDITGTGLHFGWSLDNSGQPLSADLASASSNLGIAYSGKAELTGRISHASSYLPGDTIGPANYKSSPNQTVLFNYHPSTQAYEGHWPLGSTAFAGLRADTGYGYRYGWMRITTPASLDAGAPLILVDWAYETELDTPIKAGEGIPAPTPVPTIGAPAALAAARRLRRSMKPAQADGSAITSD
jgi:hypothetical protein